MRRLNRVLYEASTALALLLFMFLLRQVLKEQKSRPKKQALGLSWRPNEALWLPAREARRPTFLHR